MVFEHYYCNLYKADVMLYSYCTTQDANEHYQKTYERTEKPIFDLDQLHGGCVTPVYTAKGERHYIVWVQDDHLETIVHEAFHIVARIFEDVGIELTEDNHEPWAYYLEYWVSKFKNTLKEAKKEEEVKKQKEKRRKEAAERRKRKKLKEKKLLEQQAENNP